MEEKPSQRLIWACGQNDRKFCSLPRRALHANLPLMMTNNYLMHHRQPEADSFRNPAEFCRIEIFKNLRNILLWYSAARIRNFNGCIFCAALLKTSGFN